MRAVHPHAVTAYDTGSTGALAAAVAPAAAGRVGFFGKLPDRGDFVRRDLPNSFVDAWDAWVQAGMEASRAVLGEGWLDAWLCAPVWRFALPRGACGPDPWAGVMMPSVDRAGRYFPLMLAASPPPGVPPQAMLEGHWIAAVEGVALLALAEGTDFDRFGAAVAGLPPFPAILAEAWAEGWRARGPAGDPAALTLALGAAGAAAALGGLCIFATNGGGRVAPAAWVLPHLPPHRAFTGLIDDQQWTAAAPGPVALPAGMAVPLAIGGVAAVAPVAASETALGHAASLFGSEFATDLPETIPAEPPGGAFDRLLEDQPQQLQQAPLPPPFDSAPLAAVEEPGEAMPAPAMMGPGPADVAPPDEGTKEVRLSPKDLFGDVEDDVPPAPPAGLFDLPGDKGSS